MILVVSILIVWLQNLNLRSSVLLVLRILDRGIHSQYLCSQGLVILSETALELASNWSTASFLWNWPGWVLLSLVLILDFIITCLWNELHGRWRGSWVHWFWLVLWLIFTFAVYSWVVPHPVSLSIFNLAKHWLESLRVNLHSWAPNFLPVVAFTEWTVAWFFSLSHLISLDCLSAPCYNHVQTCNPALFIVKSLTKVLFLLGNFYPSTLVLDGLHNVSWVLIECLLYSDLFLLSCVCVRQLNDLNVFQCCAL